MEVGVSKTSEFSSLVTSGFLQNDIQRYEKETVFLQPEENLSRNYRSYLLGQNCLNPGRGHADTIVMVNSDPTEFTLGLGRSAASYGSPESLGR